MEFSCKCGKVFGSAQAVGAHWRFCNINPIAAPRASKKYKSEYGRDFYKDPDYRLKQSNIRKANIAAGFTISNNTRKTLSDSLNRYWDNPTNRKKQSDRMRKAVLDNPTAYSTNNVVGRVKNIQYNGALLKGSWELLVAQSLDTANIKWTQPTIGIPYVWNESEHLYFPDFYLEDYDLFLEVKGYERERDTAKWASVPNIMILKSSQIFHIRQHGFKSLLT